MAQGPSSEERKANRRGAARLAAVQALYQMDIASTGLNEILAEFESHWIGREVEGDQYLPAEAAFFKDVVAGVVRDQAKLDPLIDDALQKGWPLKRIDAILRAVLRAGSYELEHRKDVLVRRTQHRLEQIANRLEILEGYLVAYLNLDEVIRIIREEDEPKPALMKRFNLTETQTEAILNMSLRALRKAFAR